MNIFVLFVLCVIGTTAYNLLFLSEIWDVGQCDRVCNLAFHSGMMFPQDDGRRKERISGTWLENNRNLCECHNSRRDTVGIVKRLYQPVEVGYPYIWRDSTVCGYDGKQYASAESAHDAGAQVANCGRCGRCSNPHDIGRLRELGSKELVKKVSPCIVSYMLFPFTKKLDQLCMESHVGFTKGCAECWVEDHGCLFAHCFDECVLNKGTWLSAFSTPEGSQKLFDGQNTKKGDGCIHCMEVMCSKPYIDSCGANRRSAGIRSEIDRDVREICTVVD